MSINFRAKIFIKFKDSSLLFLGPSIPKQYSKLRSKCMERFTNIGRMREWPKVESPIVPTVANQSELRKQAIDINTNKQKPFVINKKRVISWFPFLDQSPLKKQCFCFIFNLNDTYVVNEPHHGSNLSLPSFIMFAFTKVASHSFTQVLSLPNIQQTSQPVFH